VTAYQNTTSYPMLVSVAGYVGAASCTVEGLTGTTSTPGTIVYLQGMSSGSYTDQYTVTLTVMPSQYYEVTLSGSCGQTTDSWQEIVL
jgi:hypothetical protein